jgi:RNA polymerase sigma-70 factor (ECF subfamily)
MDAGVRRGEVRRVGDDRSREAGRRGEELLRSGVLRGTEVVIGPDARCAHEALEAKLRPFVARRVPPSDVDDVVQDVFVRVQRGLGALRDEERFGPWVYRVARSAVAEYRRDRARHPVADREASEDVSAIGEEPAESLEELLAACVVPFIAMLPSPYREALTLTELQGLTQREAAGLLGVSVSGMKSRVQRGRERLRARFEECCQIALDARGQVIACEPREHHTSRKCTCSE